MLWASNKLEQIRVPPDWISLSAFIITNFP